MSFIKRKVNHVTSLGWINDTITATHGTGDDTMQIREHQSEQPLVTNNSLLSATILLDWKF